MYVSLFQGMNATSGACLPLLYLPPTHLLGGTYLTTIFLHALCSLLLLPNLGK